MSAALAAGKPARKAPKAEYSIVLSSDTRKAATLATQNTGHGDARTAWVSAEAAGRAAGVTAFLRCAGVRSGGLRQVARPRRREPLPDELRPVVGEHLVEPRLEPVERALDDVFGAGLRAVESAGEGGVDVGDV